MALAKLILAFYPPEILTPFSPITVLRPLPNTSRSADSWAALIVHCILSSLYDFPNRILSLTVAEKINGSYSTYAIDPFTILSPLRILISSSME